MRRLQLEIIEEDGTRNRIWVASHPLRAGESVWKAIAFFAEYLIRHWEKIT